VDKWLKQWLSEPRLLRYLNAADGDDELCMQLYVWNSQIAAALLRDLADLEVLVRNKFNHAIDSRRSGTHWLLDPNSPLRTPMMHRRRGGVQVDANARIRERIERAIADAGGVNATPGHVVAELTFGFWLSLVRRNREHEMWTRYVVHSFVKPWPARSDVEQRMSDLNDLRNRVAHHEHLLTTDIAQHHGWLIELAGWLSPKVADHIAATSTVTEMLANKPL
jgi:hypothetical protein